MTPHQINLLLFSLLSSSTSLSRPCDSCKRMHLEHEHFVLCMFIDAINSLKYASPASFVFALFACTLCASHASSPSASLQVAPFFSSSSSSSFSFLSLFLIVSLWLHISLLLFFFFFSSLCFSTFLLFLFFFLFSSLISSLFSVPRTFLISTGGFLFFLLLVLFFFYFGCHCRVSSSSLLLSSSSLLSSCLTLFSVDLLCHTLYFFVLLLSPYSWFIRLSLIVIFNVSLSFFLALSLSLTWSFIANVLLTRCLPLLVLCVVLMFIFVTRLPGGLFCAPHHWIHWLLFLLLSLSLS